MANLTETVWVNTEDEFRVTIDRYLAQGGVVQNQTPGATTLYVKKQMNIVVLVVGLVLCLVPGIAYLIWYSMADQNQVITVRIGKPDNIGGYKGGGHDQVPPAPEFGATPPPGEPPPSY